MHSHSVSSTDKVRIKSLISSTRVAAVERAEKSGYSSSVLDMLNDEETEEEDDELTGPRLHGRSGCAEVPPGIHGFAPV